MNNNLFSFLLPEPPHARLPLFEERATADQVALLRQLVNDLYTYHFSEARANLLSLLAEHTPADEKERRDQEIVRQLVLKHPNILCRNCEEAHITGSALVVNPFKGEVLLHFHKKLSKWLQFGGHLGFEKDPKEGALREAIEETGISSLSLYEEIKGKARPIDIDVHTIPERKGEPEHLHLDFRYVVVTTEKETTPAVNDDESQDFLWIPFQEISLHEEKIDLPLRRMIQKAHSLVVASRHS